MTSVSSTTALSQLSLEGMPKDHCTHLAPFIGLSGTAVLACTNRSFKAWVETLRLKITHLDLSFNKKRSYLVIAEHFKHALRLHPNFNSIDFSGNSVQSSDIGLAIASAFKGRDMKAVISSGTQFHALFVGNNTCISPWKLIFEALDPTASQRGTPSTLEHLESDYSEYRPNAEMFRLISQCEKIKKIIVPLFGVPQGDLIRALHPSLEFLGPNWAPVSDELATLMMSRFLPANIQGCDLVLCENAGGLSEEKRLEFLQFLPMETMSEIKLNGTRNYENAEPWQMGSNPTHLIISNEFIDQITARLSQNTKLKALKLTGLSPSDNLVQSIVQLIHSIQSTCLEELVLDGPISALPDMTAIFEAIRAKLPQWPKLRTIQIGNLSTNCFVSATIKQTNFPTFIEHICAQNPDPQIYIGLTLIFNITSIPSILDYYAKLHNKLDPANSITAEEVLQYSKSLLKDQNTNWNTTTELAQRVLEPAFQQVKQTIDSKQMLAGPSSLPQELTAEERRNIRYEATKSRLNKDKGNT